MIKKMSKVTSILVAAAAVVSLIPATGANAATKQLATKEGTIEKAIAFDGGKYMFDGYKTQDDQTAVYYNDGTTDKQIEDFNADSMTKFSNKYAELTNGSDEYLVDLSNGTVADDTAADRVDNVKTRLKSTLSKTDRYGTIASTDKFTKFDQVAQGQFGDTWYSYSVTTTGGANYNGYVSDAGKYIDADVTANMYVKDGTNKTIKVEEFGKANSGSSIVVTKDDSKTKQIAEDKDYIYREVTVGITGSTTSSAVYIQKISKAQGTTKDGAYLPNSVTSYEVSNAYDSSDATNATSVISDTNAQFRVINGVLYATQNTGSKVTVTTIKLKQDKVALTADTTKTKLDVYLAEQDVQKDYDIEAASAVSIDVDGNTWAVDKGEVVKFDGADFAPVYSVDRSFNSLDVYNADSLIAWAVGQDAYATVDKQSNTGTPGDTTTPVVQKGWVKNTDGTWIFNKADGTKATGWVQDGAWYYLNASGIMQTGWVKDNGTWYFLTGSGAMKTGWVNDNGTWYFLQSSGAMKTGWFLDTDGNWYYLNASGAMLANTTVDGYKLGASGAWIK